MAFQIGFHISFENYPMENPASIVGMVVKSAKECLQHWNVLYAKCHCVNHLQKRLLEQSRNSWYI